MDSASVQDERASPGAPGAADQQGWIDRLDAIGEDLGYFERLGSRHYALFCDDSCDTLLVTFEAASSIRTGSREQLPYGFGIARPQGWSHLALISDGATWFRDPAVWGYFDRLVDDAFFEDFDRVVFYGAGMGGYAAAAYSVAAPGATVLCARPLATLDPRVAGWEARFRDARRLDFTSRYGFAPDMTEGAGQVWLLFDPEHRKDAMHAALFTRPYVGKLRCPHFGGRLEQDLDRIGILPELIRLAGRGELNAAAFHRLFRARRSHLPYLLRVMARLEAQDRFGLAARLGSWLLANHDGHPRLRGLAGNERG